MSNARRNPANRTFAATVNGRTVRAWTQRDAEVAMGRLMCDATVGARGTITNNGEIVVRATCTGLGWMTDDAKAQAAALLADR